VTAVGTPTGAVAASARIGPAGGRLDAPDYSLAVVVPPGAFDREQTVSLQPIENHAPGALGMAWRITPEGVTAAKPITLEWRAVSAVRESARRLRIASQGADGVWRSAAATQDDEGIVRTTTTHFSDWSLVAGVQLRPAQAEVLLDGVRDFTVRDCGSSSDPKNPNEQVHHTCRDDAVAALATSNWSVNGVPLGNAVVGQLSGSDSIKGSTHRYKAPATLPARNPVAVSVDYRDPFVTQSKSETLVAHVTLTDPDAGCDWARSVQAMDMAVELDYSWAGSDYQVNASYSHTARVNGRLQRDPNTPIGAVWFVGSLNQGTVKANHAQSSRIVKENIEVKGEGAPLDLPSVRAFLDLQTCRLILSASHAVQATHWAVTKDGAGPLPNDKAAMAFSVTDYHVGGLRTWSQERLFPVVQHVNQAMDRVSIEAGAHHDFGFAIGTARVRWTLTPR
jgi:hypothetical protein